MELIPIERNDHVEAESATATVTVTATDHDNIDDDEQVKLQWAAIQRLPSFKRLKTSLFEVDRHDLDKEVQRKKRVVDVTKLEAFERHLFIDKLIKHIETDNLRLLHKLKQRIDRYERWLFFSSTQ